MVRRRQQHDAPPGGVERRREHRRSEDDEREAIIQHAVEDAPIVHRILRAGKLAAAVAACSVVIGASANAIGMRITGTPQDVASARRDAATADSILSRRIADNAAAIIAARAQRDSILQTLTVMQAKIDVLSLTSCQLLRRIAPDLRPDGCQR